MDGIAMGRKRGGGHSCRGPNKCPACSTRIQQIVNDQESSGRGWTPRSVGTTDDGNVVTFSEGLDYNEGHTLIADGTPSGRAFERRKEHNHYGPNREGDGGRVEDGKGDRGYYTGPGH